MTAHSDIFLQQLRQALPDGVQTILLGLSGGVDSVVLLFLLRRLTQQTPLQLAAAHLDHGLRQESAADADFVRRLCHQWGVPCSSERVDVAAMAAAHRQSVEMAGRQARQQFLQCRAREIGADCIALAHHRDDQLETFFLRLLRGSSASGLSCMAPSSGLWWRPLLPFSRREILACAAENRLSWVEDRSNADTAILRNRLRHELLPLLREINPQLSQSIPALSDRLRLEEDYWQLQIEQELPALMVSSDAGIRLDAERLRQAHPALRLRLYRAVLDRVRGGLEGVDASHLQAVESLLTGARSQASIDLPNAWVARRYRSLWFRKSAPSLPQPVDLPLPLEGRTLLPDRQVLVTQLCQSYGKKAGPDKREGLVAEFALAELQPPLRVRHWQAGDRFVPRGMHGHKKIKSYLSDNKIEQEQRRATLVVEDQIGILWLVGLRRSSRADVFSPQEKVLRITVELVKKADKDLVEE